MQRVTRRRLLGLGAAGVVGGASAVGATGAESGRQSVPTWPAAGYGPRNQRTAPDRDAPEGPVGTAWRYDTGGSLVYTTPVFARGTFFVNVDGFLYARDLSTRSHEWRQDLGGGVYSTPVVTQGTVYAGGTGLYALDEVEGGVEWYAPTEGPVTSSLAFRPSGDGGTVFARTAEGWVHAVDAASGTERWRWAAERAVGATPTVVPTTANSDDPELLVVAADRVVTALRAEDGAEVWSYEAPEGVRGTSVTDQRRVLVGSTDGTLDWRNRATGARERRREFDGRGAMPPTTYEGLVVFPQGDRVHVLTPYGEEINAEWPFRLERDAATPAVLAGGNGTFLVADDGGTVYAFRLDQGDAPRWTYDTGGPIRAAPTIGPGRAYVPSGDGVVALDPESADASTTVTSAPPPEATRTARERPPATPTPTARRTTAPAGGGTAGGESPVGGVGEVNPDPSQALGLPDGLPLVPISGLTLLGAAGLAALARRAVGGEDDTDGASSSGGGSPSGARGSSSSSAGRGSGSGGSSGAGTRKGSGSGGSSAAGAGSGGGSASKAGAPPGASTSSGGTGGGATPSRSAGTGSTGDSGALPYPVGDPSGRPGTVPTTPDLKLSYGDLDRGDRIGTGGNADVYRATAPGPDGPVELAVKEPRMEGTLHAETVDRVVREAETWADLDAHDHIVGVVDWGSEPLPWIAMEYMDAGDLGEWLDTKPSLVERLWVGYGIVKAVRHAHQHGVAHLDLKPENVLFRSTGADTWPVPKVADWGLSKHLLDHSKSVEGLTPAYAAPEQFDDDLGPTDDITDVYQLGAVLYELFTDQPPFEGRPAGVMRRILNEDPVPPSEHVDLPPAVDEMVMRALATDRDDRYDSVLYLRDDIREIVESL